MSYFDVGETELVAREGYAGMGVDWEDVTGLAKGALNFYGESERAKGRAAVAEQIAILQAKGQRAPESAGMQRFVPYLAVGGGALLLFLALRKK